MLYIQLLVLEYKNIKLQLECVGTDFFSAILHLKSFRMNQALIKSESLRFEASLAKCFPVFNIAQKLQSTILAIQKVESSFSTKSKALPQHVYNQILVHRNRNDHD